MNGQSAPLVAAPLTFADVPPGADADTERRVTAADWHDVPRVFYAIEVTEDFEPFPRRATSCLKEAPVRPRSDFGALWAGSVEVDLVGDVGVAVLLGELACEVFDFAGGEPDRAPALSAQ